MSVQFWWKMGSKNKISNAGVIFIISMVFLEAFLMVIVYEFIFIPDRVLERDIECAEVSMKIANKCSDIMSIWCMINQTRRDEIQFKLDNRLDVIADKIPNGK